MEVPLSVLLLVIVVIAVVTVVSIHYLKIYPGSVNNIKPVTANYPSGELVYKVSGFYVIPIHFAKADNTPPIGVCRMNIEYIDKNTNNVISESVVFATSPKTYINTATFGHGTVELPHPVIFNTIDTKIIIKFDSDNYELVSITLQYCLYGVSTTPKWSETLLIPETVLSP